VNAAPQPRQVLVESGLADDSTIVGCSPDEIAAIEASFGYKLPESYRDFLVVMGKRAGCFMVGSDLFYDRLSGQKKLGRRSFRKPERT